MRGGASGDIYFVDHAGDVVVELANVANEGPDEIRTTLGVTDISSFQFVENLTGISANGQTLIGNDLGNIIMGGTGGDTLDGGAGVDDLRGGNGGDVYIVDANDYVFENGAAGVDEIRTTASTYSLLPQYYVENLTGLSAAGQTLTGNFGANVIVGGTGNDILDGHGGGDTMRGGLGNDSYIVNMLVDIVVEQAGEGSDEIRSALDSLSLAGYVNVERLTGIGHGQTLTGNGLANVITGTNRDDVIDGAAGADTMIGGGGSDDYFVDDAGDVVVELAVEGNDLITTMLAVYSIANIANVESLDGRSSAGQTLTGNNVNNDISGWTGNDVLDGGLGVDRMYGFAGDDIFYVDSASDMAIEFANGGTDEIRTALSTYSLIFLDYVEKLTGLSAFGQSLTGNALANVITGGSGNDAIDGGAGADSMRGGLGNDVFIVDDAGDTVVELVGQGTDEVRTALASFSLASIANVEKLTGTSAAQTLTGNGVNNVITAGSGNDVLNGGLGADTMAGGGGYDTYFVDNAGDTVTEGAGAGLDTVQSSVNHSLGNNVENLVLLAGALNGTGNGLDNSLTGNGANNLLNGGVGADAMAGGAGHDTYVVDNAGDVVTEGLNGGNDTVQSSITYTLGDNVESLTLAGTGSVSGTGNALNNVINGNSAANFLNGGIGADFMTGGGGNDTYFVDNASDKVFESAGGGNDLVSSSVNWTLGAEIERLVLTGTASLTGIGNDLANTITGNAAANILNGGIGVDSMAGGLGNDTYIVDNLGDVATDTGGVDTVQSSVNYTLHATIDNLILTGAGAIDGAGNDLWNMMTGNSAANTLNGGNGNDVLNGGLGADTLIGGTGHDTYHVDNVDDQVIDTGGGNDHVHSSIDYVLGATLEYLTLTGSAVSGTGNAQNNLIYGNAGNNIIDGGLGVDFMVGGMGDDIYYVDSGSDSITEHLNQGTDTVMSSVNHALRGNIENLTLIGSNQVIATGNTLNNVLTGNGANNILYGGLGADTMSDGGGNDVFQYRATAESTAASHDTITGFGAGDKINLSAIDAILGTPANNDAFTFIGADAFHNVAGELRATESGGVWTIEADVNGDGLADLVIGLTTEGGYLIGAGDFML